MNPIRIVTRSFILSRCLISIPFMRFDVEFQSVIIHSHQVGKLYNGRTHDRNSQAHKTMKPNLSWADFLDVFSRAARYSKTLQAARAAFLAQARRAMKLPLIRRVYRYEDIGRHRTWLDGRAKPLQEPMRTLFALAMSDHGTNQLLATELPLLAAAARLSGDSKLMARVGDQLHEMAAWSPLQRPGWYVHRHDHLLPPDGKDGNWLATGTGVRAIADTLEILGRDNLPPATVARLDQLLAAERVSIVDDWKVKRPWYVQENKPSCNQWVLPTEGLVRACLTLGRDRHLAAYELGVANLFAHLNAHGSQGAFEEGLLYAEFTLTSLLASARAMALAGDRRIIDHPFLQQFPIWALHHFQPGGFFINAFDAFPAARGNPAMLKGMLAMAAVFLNSREALWALDHLAGGADDSLMGLISRTLPRLATRPASIRPYASYTRAMRVNWRSDWSNAATGLWVRGGDPFDSHDHRDRGHVNFILVGKPLFIEAGTPAYHNPRFGVDYGSCRGHNVLTLGVIPVEDFPLLPVPRGLQKFSAVAPITVKRLDARGGDLVVDGTAAYNGLKHWRRRVAWNARQLNVEDSVQLNSGPTQVIVFRWHLGTPRKPRILAQAKGAMITWPGVRVSIRADTPLCITCEMMPDHTLHYRSWDDKSPDHLHACLIVKTTTPVNRCRVTTTASN
jgi:hypothetical protein